MIQVNDRPLLNLRRRYRRILPALTCVDAGGVEQPRLSYPNLTRFRSAARLCASTIGGTIFPQLSELGAGAVGFCGLLNQLGVVAICLFLFPNLFCCLRGAIQTSESPRIDFQRRLKLALRFFRPI